MVFRVQANVARSYHLLFTIYRLAVSNSERKKRARRPTDNFASLHRLSTAETPRDGSAFGMEQRVFTPSPADAVTEQTQALIERLEALPEDEQDRLAPLLLDRLDEAQHEASSEEEREEDEAEDDPYGFQILIDARVTSLPPDYSVTYERDLYGRTADLD